MREEYEAKFLDINKLNFGEPGSENGGEGVT